MKKSCIVNVGWSGAYVVNVFWSDGYTDGGKIFVLYSDGTYEVFRTKNHPHWRNKDHVAFRVFVNLRVMRQKKFTRSLAAEYIRQKDEEFEKEERAL